MSRPLLGFAGVACALAAVSGPIAAAGHHDLRAHMAGHLLLGMVAPLLLVLAAPVTAALRVLPVRHGRRLVRVLRSRPARFLTHPIIAAGLDAGGLWLLYTTGLHRLAAADPWLNAAVNLHVFLAGYLFTASIVGIDPAPHRPGRPFRAVVLVAFLAAHGILAKHLYGRPPAGAAAGPAADGALLMYYGGDLIHLALIVVFCRQWYVATAPDRRSPHRPAPVPWRLPDAIRLAGGAGDRRW